MKVIKDEVITQQLLKANTKEAGFQMLLEKYQQRVYWFVRRMVVDHQLADEIVHSIFIQIWHEIPHNLSNTNLSVLLYRIATNETLNHIRNK